MDHPQNFIRIIKSTHRIVCGVNVITFRDKDTKQFVKYIPALEITGYGDTPIQANEMLNFCIDDFFKYIIKLSPKKLNAQLYNLGWRMNKFDHKEYSNTFVDTDGKLNNFNAEENSVEIGHLELENG